MLMNKNDSFLLLIDVQEKLAPHVLNFEDLVARCQWLLRLAADQNVSVVVSEQYPQGLGHTLEALQSDNLVLSKLAFSCWRDNEARTALAAQSKRQVIIIGMETHVCVLQTALDMLAAGYEVFVVVDAVSSRQEPDYRYGLKRMKQEGVRLVTSEMVFFEWVEKAGTAEFKALSKAYLK